MWHSNLFIEHNEGVLSQGWVYLWILVSLNLKSLQSLSGPVDYQPVLLPSCSNFEMVPKMMYNQNIWPLMAAFYLKKLNCSQEILLHFQMEGQICERAASLLFCPSCHNYKPTLALQTANALKKSSRRNLISSHLTALHMIHKLQWGYNTAMGGGKNNDCSAGRCPGGDSHSKADLFLP